MKKKLRFVDRTGKQQKIVETEIVVRDISHLEAQIKYPSLIQRTKKGKGSYNRKAKYKNTYLNDKY